MLSHANLPPPRDVPGASMIAAAAGATVPEVAAVISDGQRLLYCRAQRPREGHSPTVPLLEEIVWAETKLVRHDRMRVLICGAMTIQPFWAIETFCGESNQENS